MGFNKTDIEGVYLFEPKIFKDLRGSFHEAFRRDRTFEETGFDFEVKQVNTSVSEKGVIRGVHLKKYPPGQAKLVSVTNGKIIDVAIDLRKDSPTFGDYQAFELSADNSKSLLLGYGIGHAFLSVQDDTRVSYLCDSIFEPEIELAINPLQASIDWQELAEPFDVETFVISERDKTSPALSDAIDLLD